jgi:spore maturation protein CgeB
MRHPEIVLVAKPWRGGLGKYVFDALHGMFPGRVKWITTRPVSVSDRLIYLRGKRSWEEHLLTSIRETSSRAAIFINHLPLFENLEFDPNRVLWLTDGPRPHRGQLAAYGRIFLSDLGYEPELLQAIEADRYGGELPFAFSPAVHRTLENHAPSKGICFIGNRDPKRDLHLDALFNAGIRPTIAGNYFLHHSLFWRHPQYFRPAVTNERMGHIYSQHQVSLNIHAQIVRQGTNMRTFECAGYGIPQLVEYREGLERFFEPDREIVVYRDLKEMVEKARWLLGDSAARSKMAARAQIRAMEEHTYGHRRKTLLQEFLPS